MSNQSTYETDSVVSEYAAAAELQPPEQAVIALLGSELRNARMLDIGIGGGRTTAHFAPRVREYIGIDYAVKMIEACRVRFPDLAQRNAFSVCDARAMNIFSDDYFDFVLFSFNGIDYVSLEDRLQILREIARVSRKGAHFVFSTHNLNSDAEAMFAFSDGDGMRDRLTKPVNRIRFRLLNAGWRRDRARADHMILNDGAHHFRLRTLYIRADAQLSQLRESGFAAAKIFGRDGRLLTASDAQTCVDSWLHYLTTVP